MTLPIVLPSVAFHAGASGFLLSVKYSFRFSLSTSTRTCLTGRLFEQHLIDMGAIRSDTEIASIHLLVLVNDAILRC